MLRVKGKIITDESSLAQPVEFEVCIDTAAPLNARSSLWDLVLSSPAPQAPLHRNKTVEASLELIESNVRGTRAPLEECAAVRVEPVDATRLRRSPRSKARHGWRRECHEGSRL